MIFSYQSLSARAWHRRDERLQNSADYATKLVTSNLRREFPSTAVVAPTAARVLDSVCTLTAALVCAPIRPGLPSPPYA
jgi:hypothetical protein